MRGQRSRVWLAALALLLGAGAPSRVAAQPAGFPGEPGLESSSERGPRTAAAGRADEAPAGDLARRLHLEITSAAPAGGARAARGPGARSLAHPREVRGGAHDAPPPRSGVGLLGLLASPANAPPRS